ncbi:MAG: hypothetical protein A49_11720 [Methyloceanibacter sp.]|nr:MAG: hypothetical protein A49_11720 [Methyloceanibacter sp.]
MSIWESDIDEIRIDDIASAFRMEYVRLHDHLWKQVVGVNSKIFIASRILNFPFDVFIPVDNYFWRLTLDSLIDSCISSVWRITLDQDPQTLTLERLEQNLLANLETRARHKFQERMAWVRSEHDTGSFKEDIERFRHNHLAHLNRKQAMSEQIEQSRYPYKELKLGAAYASEVVRAMSFERAVSPIFMEYDPRIRRGVGQDQRSDIEKLLDDIVLNHWTVQEARGNPDMWKRMRMAVPGGRLKVINEHLRRQGQAEI